MTTPALYQQYQTCMRRIADVKCASAVLQWDQETYLPPKGASFRGQQISTLAELSHQLFSADELGTLLQELLQRTDLEPAQKRNVELTLEDFTKNKKYTPALVRALSEQVNRSFHAWVEARRQNSFAVFAPELEKLVALKKEEAEVLGYKDHLYNAHLNEYEKGATVALLDRTFGELLPAIKELVGKIQSRPQVADAFLRQHFPKAEQWQWSLWLMEQLGFDSAAGRQDLSEHPFSTSFAPTDVRITTRVDEEDFANMTWSTIHEVGHALYEQGLPESEYGLPLGEACSYSIHESQSRLWENNVGRSLPFWKALYPQLQRRFAPQLAGITVEHFYKAINKVAPSLIRTEADELTYHFHVYIRYELEKSLFDGSLAVGDIPRYWAEAYQQWLGVAVPDDRQGSLQDVHWSHGSFGYFPTYSLGSLYAAQFFAQAEKALPQLETEMEQGSTSGLLAWLRQNIHRQGRFYTSEALCQAVTGSGLDAGYFIRYQLQKYGPMYNL